MRKVYVVKAVDFKNEYDVNGSLSWRPYWKYLATFQNVFAAQNAIPNDYQNCFKIEEVEVIEEDYAKQVNANLAITV